MILSHKHKFIFIKTEKTAGTSIEIALSKFCGDDDIITPISPKDEEIRKKMGYNGPQNYQIPLRQYSRNDYLRALYFKKRLTFNNHDSVKHLINYIEKDIWNSYYKFCFERNPWDKALSWYYWCNKKQPRPSVTDFIQSKKANKIKGFELYTIDSELAVDKVYKYEDLNKAMQDIAEKIGLPELPELPNAKGGFRKDKRSYKEILNEKDKQKIATVYAREIALLGYRF